MRQKKKIVYVLIVKQKSHCKALVFLFCFSPLGAYEKVEPCAVYRYVSLGCSCSGIAVLGNLLFSKNKQTKNHHLVLFFFFFFERCDLLVFVPWLCDVSQNCSSNVQYSEHACRSVSILSE